MKVLYTLIIVGLLTSLLNVAAAYPKQKHDQYYRNQGNEFKMVEPALSKMHRSVWQQMTLSDDDRFRRGWGNG